MSLPLRPAIGEYSALDSDPRWMEILEKTLAYMAENQVPSTYWSGGQGWSPCIERSGWPKDVTGELRLRDRPQLDLSRKFMPGR